MSPWSFRAAWRGCAALLLLVVIAGCGGPSKGQVSGRVLLDGAPLPGGMVTFLPVAGGNAVTVPLDANGNYPPVELPVGETMVCVDNQQLQPPPPPSRGSFTPPPAIAAALEKMAKPGGRPVTLKAAPPRPPSIPGRYVKINPKYYVVETSGLSFKVERGDMTYDINLTSK